jgi:hypothetical protein
MFTLPSSPFIINSSTPLSHWYQSDPLPQDLFTFLFTDFLEEKRGNKKLTFSLVCDKGSYTGTFLVIFPCISVL